MARLIIDYPDDTTALDAVGSVWAVVKMGRISEAAGVRHFCWASDVRVGPTVVIVIARRKKKGQASDSFVVERK